MHGNLSWNEYKVILHHSSSDQIEDNCTLQILQMCHKGSSFPQLSLSIINLSLSFVISWNVKSFSQRCQWVRPSLYCSKHFVALLLNLQLNNVIHLQTAFTQACKYLPHNFLTWANISFPTIRTLLDLARVVNENSKLYSTINYFGRI